MAILNKDTSIGDIDNVYDRLSTLGGISLKKDIIIGTYIGTADETYTHQIPLFVIDAIIIQGQKMDNCTPGTRTGVWNFGMCIKGQTLDVEQSYSMAGNSHIGTDVITIDGDFFTVKNDGGCELNNENARYMFIAIGTQV